MSNSDDLPARLAELERQHDLFARRAEQQMNHLAFRLAQLELRAAELEQAESLDAEATEKLGRLGSVTQELVENAEALRQLIDEQRAEITTLRADLGDILGKGAPPRALLDYYERRVQPTGRALIDWLREIKAEDHYRAIVALRSRRRRH